MNREDIIRMAHKARLAEHMYPYQLWSASDDALERFAALVAAAEREAIKWNSIHSCHTDCQNPACVIVREAVAAEREACAKVCEDLLADEFITRTEATVWDVATLDCAAAIRARGQG
jgi:hypothetical protein